MYKYYILYNNIYNFTIYIYCVNNVHNIYTIYNIYVFCIKYSILDILYLVLDKI